MKRIALLLLVVLFVSCNRSRVEYSDMLHEDAFVVEAVYTPSKHDTQLEMSATRGRGLGMSYSGNIGVKIGSGMQISSVTVPEKFAVVFKCQHGKFIITRRDVYDQLKYQEGKEVIVNYREVYNVTYDKDSVISRELFNYDFVNAEVK